MATAVAVSLPMFFLFVCLFFFLAKLIKKNKITQPSTSKLSDNPEGVQERTSKVKKSFSFAVLSISFMSNSYNGQNVNDQITSDRRPKPCKIRLCSMLSIHS